MEENSNINPEILEEVRRLVLEIGFGEEMANILMEKYQMRFSELDPYFDIIDRELSQNKIDENDENEVKDYIKQLIDEYGKDQKLWVCKLTAEKYQLRLREAKKQFDDLCGISGKEEDYFPQYLTETLEERELRKKEAEKKSDIIVKLSLAIMAIAVILILAPLGIENFPKVFFNVGIVFFIVAMVMMIASGNNKKR